MPSIYIISRPDETTNLSDYIAELLRARYGPQNVKRGSVARSAAEYPAVVERDLRASDVALVVIGPRWATNLGANGQPWLTQPSDPARIALATALRLGLLIAPVLSDGAKMPYEAELPPDLRRLPQIQAILVRPAPYFREDMIRLYQQINTKLTWRPTSIPLVATSMVSALLWLALAILGTAATGTPVVQAVAALLAVVGLLVLLVALIIAFTVAIQRKSRRWPCLLAGAIVIALASFALPKAMVITGLSVLIAALLAFAFVGPRRETAFA